MVTFEDDDLSGDGDYDMGLHDRTAGSDSSVAQEPVLTTTPVATISTSSCIRGARCLQTSSSTSSVLEWQDTSSALDSGQAFSISMFFRLEEAITGPDAGAGDPDNGLGFLWWNPANSNMVSLNHANHYLPPSDCGTRAGFTMSGTGVGGALRTAYSDTHGVENANFDHLEASRRPSAGPGACP